MYYRYGSCYVYGYFARLGIEVTKTEEKKREFKDELTDTWFVLGIVFGAFLVVGTLFMYLFGDKIAFQGRQCAFLTITHLYCPGCGGTRSFYYFLHGKFIKSVMFNPFVPYTLAAYFVFMINTILVKTTKKAGFTRYPASITIYVGVGLLIVQCIVRNILLAVCGITCL